MRASIVFSLLLAVGLIAQTNAAPLASASCSTNTPNGISVTPGPNAITKALANLASNGATYTLLLAAGTYTEQVVISRDNVVLRGCGTVKVQFAKGVSTSGNNNNAVTSVLTVSASNFAAYDISFNNINPQARDTAALALTVDINAKNVGFYRCTFFGFQDTVLIHRGAMAYFSNCYIEGSADFLWGMHFYIHNS
ncbi:pectin lyase fold/virulence factor [Jimgerdemannia flammicorona]|uniref:pectinesterase n=1 Tax=Jimgerdemannia flammicorona TaxID=994334 RepID=A0A433DHJ4_9FUNG|nr:pectin lyase fold/virulence factor [Jimgerdemannia flammicorona]